MFLTANRAIAALLAVSLLQPAPLVAQSAEGNDISLVPDAAPAFNLRLHDGLSDDLIRRIAMIGEPTLVQVLPGENAKTYAASKCGNSRSAYMSLTLNRNRALQINSTTYVIGGAGTLELPACAIVEQSVRLTPTSDQDLAVLLTEATGYAGDKTLAAFRAKNPGFPRGVTTVRAGQTIVLPYRSRISTIKLRPRYAQDPATVLGQLKMLLAQAMSANTAAIGRFIPAADRGQFQDAANKECPVTVAGTDDVWPFQAQAFLDALERVSGQSRALWPDGAPTKIAILDSGFPPVPVGPFVEARLARKPGQTTFDRYGISGAADKMPPFADPRDDDANHGTMVSVLALGGTGFLQRDTKGVSRLQLRLERVIEPDAGGAIYDGAVLNGLNEALSQGATVINASFEFPSKLDSILVAMANNPDVVMVVAAGNDGRQPGVTPRYPANYGGDRSDGLKGRFISVGASTQSAELAPFSAYGADYVDVLAPGCDIPTLWLDLTPHTDLGTSLSAPIVTFLVATARQLGLNSPQALRERALISADPKAPLYSQAFSAGVINPFKMIELHRDVVEMKADGPLRLGRVTWTWDKLPLCLDSPWPLTGADQLLKLGRLEGGSEWLAIWRTGGGDLRRCRAQVDDTQTVEMEGSSDPVALASIKDIVIAPFDDDQIRDQEGR